VSLPWHGEQEDGNHPPSNRFQGLDLCFPWLRVVEFLEPNHLPSAEVRIFPSFCWTIAYQTYLGKPQNDFRADAQRSPKMFGSPTTLQHKVLWI